MNTFPETVNEALQETSRIPQNVAPQLERFVRENPTTALLAAVGIGCAVGILSRTLMHSPPPPPKHRALQILEDIQGRLSELVGPTYNHASHLAEDGVSAVRKGLDTLNDLPIGRRLKSLFNH